jgi:SanA protein
MLGLVVVVLCILCSNILVSTRAQNHIVTTYTDVQEAQTIIILGASVRSDGSLSSVLKERLDTGISLYRIDKAPKILLSGDNSTPRYNEVEAMRKYLVAHDVPEEDIFMDYAGFDTYDTMYRARDVFQVKSAIIVTQPFHLSRSVYIARRLGIDAQGYRNPSHVLKSYDRAIYREWLARVKAVWEVEISRPKPKFLGQPIPITGDGNAQLGT